MKKGIGVVLIALVVLIAATACQPKIIWVPGMGEGSGNGGGEVIQTPTVTNQEEFTEALKKGEAVILAAGADFTIPQSVIDDGKPVNITGPATGEKPTVRVPVNPAGSGNNGEYNLPKDSVLVNVTVVFDPVANSIQAAAYRNNPATTEPPFAMLIKGSATISNVTFVFPANSSLSGINIYQATGVSLSDITIDGNPARAPFNITNSTVKFSGTFGYADDEATCGWYGALFTVQVNAQGGDVNEASNLDFSGAEGINAIWQERVADVSVTDENKLQPSASGQTQVKGFDDNFFYMKKADDTDGWMWLSDEVAQSAYCLYMAFPAHQRMFNRLNGFIDEALTVTAEKTDLSLATSVVYNLMLQNYSYTSLDKINDIPTMQSANGGAYGTGKLELSFTGSYSEEEFIATRWTLTGSIDADLIIPAVSEDILNQLLGEAGGSVDFPEGGIPEIVGAAKVTFNLSGNFVDDSTSNTAIITTYDETYATDQKGEWKEVDFTITNGKTLKFGHSDSFTGSMTVNGVEIPADVIQEFAQSELIVGLGGLFNSQGE